jgi:hypothetical protein
MSRTDEYRRNAAECQRMAESTRDEGDKRSWLRLAQSWLRLVSDARREGASPDATESFATEHRARGTGQRESESTH